MKTYKIPIYGDECGLYFKRNNYGMADIISRRMFTKVFGKSGAKLSSYCVNTSRAQQSPPTINLIIKTGASIKITKNVNFMLIWNTKFLMLMNAEKKFKMIFDNGDNEDHNGQREMCKFLGIKKNVYYKMPVRISYEIIKRNSKKGKK